MSPLTREPAEPTNPPERVCVRCLEPIRSGTGSQVVGRAVHMCCLMASTQLGAIEQRNGASREAERPAAAIDQANGPVNPVRRKQTHCPACGEPFGLSRSVLFQGDRLVHAACWRDDPKPFDDPPPAG